MNTQYLNVFFILVFGVLPSPSSSSKFVSIAEQRHMLADDEFSFSFFRDGIPLNMANGTRFVVILARFHRLVGMKNVDVACVRVAQSPGPQSPGMFILVEARTMQLSLASYMSGWRLKAVQMFAVLSRYYLPLMWPPFLKVCRIVPSASAKMIAFTSSSSTVLMRALQSFRCRGFVVLNSNHSKRREIHCWGKQKIGTLGRIVLDENLSDHKSV